MDIKKNALLEMEGDVEINTPIFPREFTFKQPKCIAANDIEK
jgi:hypothetical protein